MDEFNGTRQIRKAEFMIAAANTCKDYVETFARANKIAWVWPTNLY